MKIWLNESFCYNLVIFFMKKIWYRITKYLHRLHVPGNENRVERYGFAIILVIIYFLVKTTLIKLWGHDLPFLFALFVVLLSAWFGGFGPGLLATFSTSLIVYFIFLDPRFSFDAGQDLKNFFIISIFIIQGIIISILSDTHRKSDRMKSEFVGIISHELKNPMTSIKAYTGIIKLYAAKKKEKKLAEYAQKIDRQVTQLTLMIQEMLDITTIEAGKLTYHDEIFTLNTLIKEVIHDNQVTTDTHKITFSKKVSVKMFGDRYRIGQVISNLLSNAIKYSPDANSVRVSLKKHTNNVEIRVKDFGPGITPSDQKNVFKPFFRSKKTRKAKGTGIGLFISSQIVEHHEGKIRVESVPGKGSVFCVQLPYKKQK